MNKIENNAIILFDGVCNLCNASVNFIIKRDADKKFLFASLQSEIAQKLLQNYQTENSEIDSIILIENGNIYTKSTAVLRIAKQLSGFYKILYSFSVIPKGIRDFCYDFIVKNRYTWFGRKEQCMLPSEDVKSRFLE